MSLVSIDNEEDIKEYVRAKIESLVANYEADQDQAASSSASMSIFHVNFWQSIYLLLIKIFENVAQSSSSSSIQF